MKYAYDTYGWYSGEADVERSTDIEPPTCKNGEKPNWTGVAWVCVVYAPPVPPAPVVHTYGSKLTQLAFMSRFTSAERKAIKAKAAIDADVGDVWDLMGAATYIDLALPTLVGGMELIVSKVPELTSARSAAIRTLPVTDPLELPGSVRVVYGLSEIP